MTNQYDILIVGAGMVGTSLALALSSLPLRIALVENFPIQTEAKLDADGRSLALTYGSARTLQTVGVWKNIENYATPIQMVHVSDYGHFGKTRIKASEYGVPALGYVVPAPILGTELNKALIAQISPRDARPSFSKRVNTDSPLYKREARGDFTLFNPATVQSLTSMSSGSRLPSRDDDEVSVGEDFNWEVALLTSQGMQTITAKLIIAADGTNSTIRALQNITTEEKDYQQSAIATAITLTNDHQNIAYERFTNHGALAFLPLQDKRGGFVWTGPHQFVQELQSLGDEDFLQYTQKYFGYRLGKLLQVSKRHVYPLKMIYAKEQVREGLVLIGNAAHTIHPIAAQGLNLGLTDVALLTESVSAAVREGKKIHELALLQEYECASKAVQQKIMQFTDSLTQAFLSDFLPLTLARNASLLTLDIFSPLKRRLAKRLMGVL